MEVLYSLILIFTINGQQFSESVEHFLSHSKCKERGFELTKKVTQHPPFFMDRKGDVLVLQGSNPFYVCAPTSIKKTKSIIIYEFPGNFTINLKGSRKFLQVGIGVSTHAAVKESFEIHQLELRSGILTVMSEFTEEDIQGKTGRENLAKAISKELNNKLVKLEGFGVIEEVYFTSFVLQ